MSESGEKTHRFLFHCIVSMYMNLLKLDKTAEYATLREWCITIGYFIVSTYPEMSDFVNGMKETITRIDKKQSIRQMRSMYKEMNWLIQDGYLPDSAMDALNQVLTEKFQYNLVDVAPSEKDEIRKILKRSKIGNDREYRLIRQQEENIYEDESQIDYAESLRHLLRTYEMNS